MKTNFLEKNLEKPVTMKLIMIYHNVCKGLALSHIQFF